MSVILVSKRRMTNKAQLKNDFVEFKNSRYFKKDVNKEEIMKKLFEVIINANLIMKLQ